MPAMIKGLGDKLQQLRLQLKLSQKEVAVLSILHHLLSQIMKW